MRCPNCQVELEESPRIGDLCPSCGGDLETALSSTIAAPSNMLPDGQRRQREQHKQRQQDKQRRARRDNDSGSIKSWSKKPREVRSDSRPSRPSTPSDGSSIDGARFVAGTVVAERYRISGRLGRGGMGEVYKAEDLKLGEAVALKFLPETLASDGVALARLHKEVRVARQIAHANVCRVFDVSEADGLSFIVMEYIDGEDLASLLRRIGRLPAEKALELARQICAGLAAVHQRGVLHCDLKPANVMIDGRGRAKITDFGLAGVARDGDSNEIFGTPAYMAPEQLVGGNLAATSDLYSLALVIYEMLTGTRLFAKAGVYERLSRLHKGPLKIKIEEASQDLEKILQRCLEVEPDDRPSSVFEIEAVLAGGDPLAAAMRAGEIPSPAMVARARRGGTLARKRATVWLSVFLISLVAAFMLAERTTDLGQADLTLSPEILADRAQNMLDDLGWAREEHRASALDYDLERRDEKAPFVFWFRQSPTPMAPLGRWAYRPTVDDPPLNRPGMVFLELSADGVLWRLRAQPIEGEAQSADWEKLFELAGLPSDLSEVTPQDTPHAYADERRAWAGTPGGKEIRVEAAAWRGRVVYLEIHNGSEIVPVPLRSTAWWLMINALFLTLWIGSFLVLRYNLRRSRSDEDGARRLFLVSVAAALISWFFEVQHSLGGDELQLFVGRLAATLMRGAILWLLYMALEPTVRQRWPDALVSWTRLLSGRWQDPLIGRHLLQGMTLYLTAHSISQLVDILAIRQGWIDPRPLQYLEPKLAGGWRAVGFYLDRLTWLPILTALAVIFFMVCLRMVIRRTPVAAVVLGALLFLVSVADPAVTPFGAVAWAGAAAYAAMRWGMVAVFGIGLVVELVVFCPMTTDPSLWYSTTTAFGLGMALVLGIWGYRQAIGAAVPMGASET